MRFRAALKPFAEAALAAARTAATRETIPVLTHVKLAAAGDEVRLTATDLDREIELSAPATVEEAGETTVKAQKLADALRVAPKDAEVFVVDEGAGSLKLSTGRPRYVFPTLPTADFPSFAKLVDFAAPLEFAGKALAAMLTQAGHASARDATRPMLEGVYLHAAAEGLRFVGCDGFRLMVIESGVASSGPNVILPTESVKAFARAAEGVDKVLLELSPSLARLTAKTTQLVSKLIDGTYPDYPRIVPQDFVHRAEFEAEEMSAALARADVGMVGDRPSLALDFDVDAIKLDASGSDHFAVSDRVAFEGEASIKIGFRMRDLREAIGALDGERLRLEINNAQGATKLSAPLKRGRFVVLMPDRL